MAARESVAELLDVLDVGELAPGCCDAGDRVGGELRAGHAGHLENAQLIVGQALHARLDRGPQSFGDPFEDLLDVAAELPAHAIAHEQTLLDQLVDERDHEERVSGASLDQEREQIGRELCPGEPGREVRRDSAGESPPSRISRHWPVRNSSRLTSATGWPRTIASAGRSVQSTRSRRGRAGERRRRGESRVE